MTSPLVLVVDDERAVRRLAQQALELAGYRVAVAPDGADGVRQFELLRPDLVLMDVMMPEMDGFAACGAIREHAQGSRTPILMMTGRDDVEAIHRAYEVGATDFVSKPVPWAMLGYRVQYMLRSAAAVRALSLSEARLQAAQDAARLGHWECDDTADTLVLSEMARALLGGNVRQRASFGEVLQRVHADDRERLLRVLRSASHGRREIQAECRLVEAGDRCLWVLWRGRAEPNDSDGLTVRGTVQDITDLKRRDEETRRLAYFDSLTGLPNRLSVTEHLEQSVAAARREGSMLAVLLLDLDNFRRVNETLSHAAGDTLLKAAARVLQDSTASTSLGARGLGGRDVFLGRMGGDEFGLVMKGLQSVRDVDQLVRLTLESLRTPTMIDGQEVMCAGSVGIAIFPMDGVEAGDLMANADMAMYQAKGQGGNCASFSNRPMRLAAANRLTLEAALRRALERDQFFLEYQPKWDVREERVTGVEALIRWRHPELGVVPPLEFIPIAEETGLIAPIGEWAVREACAQVRHWRDAGHTSLRMAINLSARQFVLGDPVAMIAHAAQQAGVDGSALEVEITESLVMRDVERGRLVLERLRSLGCRVSIDDFGTGYSSLAYLKRFPIDCLKIDRAFVRGLPDDSDDVAIVDAVLTLAKSLGVTVVAEGVETSQQLAHLAARGCHEVQGYLVSRPASAEQVSALLATPNELAVLGDGSPAEGGTDAALALSHQNQRGRESERQ